MRSSPAQIPSEQRLHYRQTLLHTSPFTSLAKVGDKLFTWPQSPATEQERTYYNAALGLFLLIADTYGEQTIRYIMREIADRETVDGKDLIEIANRVLGTDVRRLAEEFQVPRARRRAGAVESGPGPQPGRGPARRSVCAVRERGRRRREGGPEGKGRDHRHRSPRRSPICSTSSWVCSGSADNPPRP